MRKLTVMDVIDVLSNKIQLAFESDNRRKSLYYLPLKYEYIIKLDEQIIARTNDMENAVTIYNQTEI